MLLQEAFEILELTEDADRTKIRHAYANLSKIYHVETHPKEFARLHEAYKLALSAAGNLDAQALEKKDLKRSEQFASSAKDNADFDSYFSKEKNSKSKNTLDNLLAPLLGTDFSIQNCCESIQLLYYRCRYDEISPEISAILFRITNAEQGIVDDFPSHYETASLPDKKKFLGIFWRKWKILDWTCIICHPDFYKVQYTSAFLSELYRFLSEETLNLRDGIRQELYFALCMAYGFFSDKKEAEETAKHPLLIKIEQLLRLHPKYMEYIKDLKIWPDLGEANCIVLFCQKIYAKFLLESDPLTDQNNNCDTDEKILSETAAELLLDKETPWKDFIYDSLTKFLDASYSKQSAKKREVFYQFSKKREEFQNIRELRQEFSCDFINLLDNNIPENYIYNSCYLPLAIRLDRIKDRYLTKKEWKKIICHPVFFQNFKNWILPRHNGFLSVPCIMHYDAWKLLRICLEGSSSFEKDSIQYLTTEFYFSEYEKRYQRELIWEEDHIEEVYLKETFPLPSLSQGKLDLLRTMENAAPATIQEIEKIWGNLSFDSDGFDFLTRISRAMTHFNFLLVTSKYEKGAVPGDAFCFLKDEVLLYRKKENILCRLTHPVFYDLISWKFEAAAFHVITGKPGYDENFLDTACRNLYCYRYYASHKRMISSSSKPKK